MEFLRQWQDGFLETPELGYEGWRERVLSLCGSSYGSVTEPRGFAGTAGAASRCGFFGLEIGINACRFERTQYDIRSDEIDWYHVIFQKAGRLTVTQNDQAARLASGQVALIDAARPAAYICEGAQFLSLKLQRASLLSYLGCEPQTGSCGTNSGQAERLLFQLVLESGHDWDTMPIQTGSYIQLAIYDLTGALFSPASGEVSVSPHTDKLFRRICALIEADFADPDFGPSEVAAKAGISLRYLQKLFRARGLICHRYIQSVRLDNAAHILSRRAMQNRAQPLSEIAYTCGFNDYHHFARTFRQRFGHSPTAH
jgi:AraC family transcriptional activator of tynA and feaB